MIRLSIRLRRLQPAPTGDDGSALILALVVTVAIGLILMSALDFAGTGLANVPHFRDQRNQINYAQGTVDGAINNIRNSTVFGTTAVDCPTFTPPVLASGLNSGADGTTQFQATCTALDSGQEPGTFAPVWAIQTLGTGLAPQNPNCNNPCPAGINQSTGTNNTLSIDGGIYSAGRVWNKGSGGVDMEIEGSVYAAGTCSGTIHTTDKTLHCGQAQDFGKDPSYPSALPDDAALTTLMTPDPADPLSQADALPTCPSTNSNIAWFSPGYYSEQPDTLLAEAADEAGSNCDGTEQVYWFQPGFYYFDFSNAAAGNDWNVNKVVGGTAGSWTSDGDNLPTDGTACDSSIDQDTSKPLSPGVQFIFGGNSTFNVGSGKFLELCGPDQDQNPGSTQSIAVYGLAAGNPNQETDTPTPVSDEVETATADPTASPPSGFHDPQNARTIDTINQSEAILGGGETDSLVFPSFQNIPKGSSNVSVKIRLARAVVGSLHNEDLFIKFPGNNNTYDVPVPASCTNATLSCDIPVPSAAWPSNTTHWRQFNKASLTYTASTSGNGAATVDVDGIALLATYTPPTLEPLAINSSKYFTSASSPNVTIYMHGTYYTPSVGLDVEGQNVGRVVFARGVVASTVLIDSNPSFTQTQAPFQTPGSKGARLVKFVGQISTDNGASWTDLVQACVKYNDNNASGSTGPALPGYTLNVKGWTVLRSTSQTAPTCA